MNDENVNNFIFIQPQRCRQSSARSRETIRIVFSKNKKKEGYVLTIYLGKGLAEKINVSADDKVAIGYDKNNNRKIMLKKSNAGYAVTKISNEKSPAFRIMLQWAIFSPDEKDFILKEAVHEVLEDGIVFAM